MLLLELTTLASSSRARKLGITIDDEDMVEVRTSINVEMITHLSQNPDSKKLTNIYLTNGMCIITPYSIDSLMREISISMEPLGDPLDKFNTYVDKI